MKKSILALMFTATLLLTGCKNNKNGNKKGDIVNDLVLKANTREIKKSIYSDFNLSNYEINVQNIAKVVHNDGFLIITNTDNELYFYSAFSHSLICGPVSENNYQTFASNVAGGYLRVTENGETDVYDGLGNYLIKKSKTPFSSVTITNPNTADTLYQYVCDVKFDNQHYYFAYKDDGSAQLVTTIYTDGNGEYGPGSSYQGLTYSSLRKYGHEGYKLFKNSSRYIVFDKNNQEISSFSDPMGDAEFFVGDFLIYQNSTKLKETDSNYDYIDAAGDKFSLETYKINYLTAKKETLKINYLIGANENDVKPFASEKGVYSYVYANLRTISEKKILNNVVETYILDSAGALHDNVTGIDLGSFQRFGNNYYNTASKTIYDGNLNEITIFNEMSPIKSDNAQLIIGSLDGKYGAVNSEGKIAIPFEYDRIFGDYLSNNQLLAIYNGTLCVVSFDALACKSSIVRTFAGYDNINYESSASGDCGVFRISGSATSEQGYPNYLSLFSSSPVNIKTNLTANMQTIVSSAEAVNKTSFSVLETIGENLSSFRSATITISR